MDDTSVQNLGLGLFEVSGMIEEAHGFGEWAVLSAWLF